MTQTASENTIPINERLSDEEIEEFALRGYVVKRQILDPDLMREAVDLMWSKMPQSFDRRDPSTWRGAVTDCMGSQRLSARDGKVKLREEIWGNKIVDTLITHNECLLRMIEQLLGSGTVVEPERFRGLYPIFPTPDFGTIRVQPHVDFGFNPPALFKVGIVAYLEDVPARGGCFTIWPESHRTLFYDCITNSNSRVNAELPEFQRHFGEIAGTEPVEFTGRAGDI